jgi:hypothetical protein
MIEKSVKNKDELNDFLRDEKELFFTNLIICIQSAWEVGDSAVDIATFHIEETSTVMDIVITSDDWLESLNLALFYFENVENYEYCEEIKQTISKIDDDE